MKKVLIRSMKFLFLVVFSSVVGMLLFGVTASAYIDPSVMTYMIQIIAGVVIAVGAIVGVYWRRAKKKVQNSLGIEEKKEIESDEIIVDKEPKDVSEESKSEH